MHENVSMIPPTPINPASVITKPTREITRSEQTESTEGFQQILVRKSLEENRDLTRDDTKQEDGDVTVHNTESEAQTVQHNLSINSIPVTENPEERSGLSVNQIKVMYSPFELVADQPSEGTGSIAITSPIASQVDTGFKSSAGLISGDVSIPEKIPIDGHSPPGQSNSPPKEVEPQKEVELNETAGPRGNDLFKTGSFHSNEEANPEETHREVSNPRSPNLMSGYFRVPVNEITKGVVSHRGDSILFSTDAIKPPELTASSNSPLRAPSYENTQTRIRAQASRFEFSDRAFDKSTSTEQSSPNENRTLSTSMASSTEVKSEDRLNSSSNPRVAAKPTTNSQAEVVDKSNSDTKRVSTESQHMSDVKTHVEAQSGGQAKSSAVNVQAQQTPNLNSAGKTVSETKMSDQNDSTSSQNHSKAQQSSTEPASEFKFKTVEQQVGSFQSSLVNNQAQQTSGATVDVGSLNGGALATNSSVPDKILELKEPVSILGDAPARIASEIAEFPTEELKNGGKAVLKVELNPPRLGRMNIELVKTESGIEVKLVVRTHFARELINQRADEIRSALQEQGIDIKKLEIVDLNRDRQDFNRQQNGLFSGDTPFEKGSNEAHQGNANNQVVHIDDEEIEMESEYVTSADKRSNPAGKNVLDILA
ncbi:MAG: flagellar hook-length control protein FliK [bacterium]